MSGIPFQGHGDFYPKVGKRIPRANELSWFALDQDFVLKLTLGIVCHGRTTPKVSSLWTRKAADQLSFCTRYDEAGPISVKG
eukprot:1145823-Pelagomonas_calceolata.AAC.5